MEGTGSKGKEEKETVGRVAFQIPWDAQCFPTSFQDQWRKELKKYSDTPPLRFSFGSTDQSIKSDKGKLQIALVPPQIIRDIAEVREYGQKKYGSSESWREVSVDRYINALLRHTLLFMEDPYGTDEESGIKHYKHMACNLAFLCELMKGE